ncbi:unnamed protein product [Microthlaspi erraticum]|uniref:F-box associated beta-propeller type 1 domain-containing protein n=1 Tax=Microthlaspi erraticum TaxID=1685480 RepID=A0A6D2K5Z8_9BRAS|nr:unnamed protein product [Microthlaspi erraticum]
MRTRMCDLPSKLVGEKILTKVPITSLGQVRSTCKLWDGLSKDWILGKEAASRTQQFLGFMTMDSKVCSLRFNLRSKDGEQEQEEAQEGEEAVDVSVKQVDILNQVEISKVYQCEGLLLCVAKDNSRLVAWNPYLGQTRTIEPRKSFHKRDVYALGFDKKTRNHKILRYLDYQEGKEHLFAFEFYDFGSNSWRLVEVRPDWEVASGHRGVSLKGDTYFFAQEKIGRDFFDPTFRSSRSSVYSRGFGRVLDCDDFLLCFDFTREKMGPRLPLPFHTLPPLGEIVSLSCVREEQLAVLFQHGGEEEIREELDVWVTTRIDPEDVSWTKFLTFDMRPQARLGVGQLHKHPSFFIDEQEKVAVVFDVMEFSNKDNQPSYHTAFVFGQDGYFKPVLLGEAPNIYTGRFSTWKMYCPPIVCSSSYLPSLVQIKLNNPRKRKERLVILHSFLASLTS